MYIDIIYIYIYNLYIYIYIYIYIMVVSHISIQLWYNFLRKPHGYSGNPIPATDADDDDDDFTGSTPTGRRDDGRGRR